jgi:hypothetical protein
MQITFISLANLLLSFSKREERVANMWNGRVMRRFRSDAHLKIMIGSLEITTMRMEERSGAQRSAFVFPFARNLSAMGVLRMRTARLSPPPNRRNRLRRYRSTERKCPMGFSCSAIRVLAISFYVSLCLEFLN